MGCFSWMYADTNNNQPLNIGNGAYLLLPNGSYYYEQCYDGYGRFDGHDVYDLVADWNKYFIPIMLAYADKGKWVCNINETDRENLIAFYNDKPISCEKRWLGIMMACYDEDNSKLFYPIKICKHQANYDKTIPSERDANQGFGHDDVDDDWY